MKKSVPFILSFIVLMAFISCKKESEPSLSNPIPWLKVGNKWIYDVTGGLTSYTTYTTEVTNNKSGIYTMASWLDDDKGLDANVYFENGFMNTFDEGQSKGANQQLLKYINAKVGDTWTRITPTETYYHEVISINETVTVPAGTFVCKKVKVTFLNAINDQDTYWSDEFGQIKIDGLFLSTELATKNF
jgi:hypothetical protein